MGTTSVSPHCEAFVNGVKVVNVTAEIGFAMLKSFALIDGTAAVPVAAASGGSALSTGVRYRGCQSQICLKSKFEEKLDA